MPVIAVIKLTSEITSQLIAYKAVEKMVLDMQGGVKVSANVETETSVLERKEDGAGVEVAEGPGGEEVPVPEDEAEQ